MDFVPGRPPIDTKTKLPINPLINEADASYFLWNCLDTLKKIHKRGIIHRYNQFHVVADSFVGTLNLKTSLFMKIQVILGSLILELLNNFVGPKLGDTQ